DTFVFRPGDSTASTMDSFAFTTSIYPGLSSFTGAGTAGGDVIELAGFAGPVFWQGQANINIAVGSDIPGGGNGVIDAFQTGNGAKTWLVVDIDDDGKVGAGDLMVQFESTINLIATDFASPQTVGFSQGLASN